MTLRRAVATRAASLITWVGDWNTVETQRVFRPWYTWIYLDHPWSLNILCIESCNLSPGFEDVGSHSSRMSKGCGCWRFGHESCHKEIVSTVNLWSKSYGWTFGNCLCKVVSTCPLWSYQSTLCCLFENSHAMYARLLLFCYILHKPEHLQVARIFNYVIFHFLLPPYPHGQSKLFCLSWSKPT